MLTPQEVSSRAFAKAVMGGYNMAMVDEFLDELTDDYTALYKENAALKAKMKILVDKVEEYRATEDSMRTALLTAQKMANTMVEEAEAKKSSLLADAEADAKKKIGNLQDEVEHEEQRLANAKAATARFLAQVRDLYEREIAMLEQLPDMEIPAAPIPAAELSAAPDTDVNDIEARIMASFSMEETVVLRKEETAPAAPAEEEEEESAEEGNPFVDTFFRRPKLSELKFGRNYRAEE